MKTTPNIEDPDAFYAALTQAHQGLSASESEAFNARLILLLANQVGQLDVLLACISASGEANKKS